MLQPTAPSRLIRTRRRLRRPGAPSWRNPAMTEATLATQDSSASAMNVQRNPWWRSTRVVLLLILLVSGSATVLAARRNSTTFDEIVMIAGGARGYQTSNWKIAPEHPPVTQYLYG